MKTTLIILILVVCPIALVGCNKDNTPQNDADKRIDSNPAKKTDVTSEDAEGNLVIFVSNQSAERPEVDIKIEIDDSTMINGLFEKETHHNWHYYTFNIPEGEHTIKAITREGETSLIEKFTLEEKLWIAIGYFYSSGKKGGIKDGPVFNYTSQEEPIFFN